MADFSFSVSDTVCQTVAEYHGWMPTVKDDKGNDVPNPVTFVSACQDRIIQFLTDEYKLKTVDDAQKEAVAAAEAQVDATIATVKEASMSEVSTSPVTPS